MGYQAREIGTQEERAATVNAEVREAPVSSDEQATLVLNRPSNALISFFSLVSAKFCNGLNSPGFCNGPNIVGPPVCRRLIYQVLSKRYIVFALNEQGFILFIVVKPNLTQNLRKNLFVN